jgi:hypothetical protein
MTTPPLRILLLLLAPVVVGFAVASCGDNGKASAKPADKSAGTQQAAAQTIGVFHPFGRVGDGGPIDYIAGTCAKCHGPEASGHKAEAIGKYRDDAKLRALLPTMFLRAQIAHPPEGDELETLIAYHRSVIVHEPFITVTDAEAPVGGTITLLGEVSSKSDVTFTVKGETMKAVMDGPTYWRATVPTDATEVTITAVRDGVKSTLDYPRHTHTHDVPLTP